MIKLKNTGLIHLTRRIGGAEWKHGIFVISLQESFPEKINTNMLWSIVIYDPNDVLELCSLKLKFSLNN